MPIHDVLHLPWFDYTRKSMSVLPKPCGASGLVDIGHVYGDDVAFSAVSEWASTLACAASRPPGNTRWSE